MGVVLLQADVSAEARNTEAQEKYCGECEFDKPLERMRHINGVATGKFST